MVFDNKSYLLISDNNDCNCYFLYLFLVSTFKKQEFRVLPKDVNAREGSNVTLSCEINDITGDVQWTKDGLALGKSIALCIKYYAVIIFFSRFLLYKIYFYGRKWI